jgi:hypothetical protein
MGGTYISALCVKLYVCVGEYFTVCVHARVCGHGCMHMCIECVQVYVCVVCVWGACGVCLLCVKVCFGVCI